MNVKRWVFLAMMLVAVIVLLTMLGCGSAAQPSPTAAVPPDLEAQPSTAKSEPAVEIAPVNDTRPRGPSSPAAHPLKVTFEFAEPPDLGREVELVLTVTSGEDLPEGSVEFQLPEEAFQVVTGSTRWEGPWVKNERKVFTLVVKAVKGGDHIASAVVKGEYKSYNYRAGRTPTLYVAISDGVATVSTTPPPPPPPEPLKPPYYHSEPYDLPLTPERESAPLPDTSKLNGQLFPQARPTSNCFGGTVTINGTALYRSEDGLDYPIGGAEVDLYDEDSTGDRFLTAVYTAPDGTFTAPNVCNDDESGGVDLFAWVIATNFLLVDAFGLADRVDVGLRDFVFPSNLWGVKTDPPIPDLPNGTFTMNPIIAGSPQGSDGNPFFIFDKIANEGREYLTEESNWHASQAMGVEWQPGWLPTTFYNPADNHIELNDGQRWEEDLILHEYGHFVMEMFYGGFPPTPNCSGHRPGIPTSQGCAWVEGWAHFLQAAVQDDPQYNDFYMVLHWDLELGLPSWTSDVDEGPVAMALWDMYDNAVDGTDAYGDNDFNTIFVVFTVGAVDANFSEYWNTWKSWFPAPNPHQCAVTSIYQGHITNYEADQWVDCGDATVVLTGDSFGFGEVARIGVAVDVLTGGGAAVLPPDGFRALFNRVEYDTEGLEILKIEYPVGWSEPDFCTGSPCNFDGSTTTSPVGLDEELAFIYPRLTHDGPTQTLFRFPSAQPPTPYTYGATETGADETGTSTISVWFQRGNPNSDSTIDIYDVITTLQVTVGLKGLEPCSPLTVFNCVRYFNAANARHDGCNDGDLVNIFDAIVMLQYITGALPVLPADCISQSGGFAPLGGTDATVTVGSATVPSGGTGSVPITVSEIVDPAGLGGYDFQIDFDPAVVRIDSITGGQAPFDGNPTQNIDNAAGTGLFSAAISDVPGPTGSLVVGNINFTAIGPPESQSALDITVKTLGNTDPDHIPAVDADGTITVE